MAVFFAGFLAGWAQMAGGQHIVLALRLPGALICVVALV